MAKLTLNYPNVEDEYNQVHSVIDDGMYMTFGPWVYLVPQFKPKNVLMLGYGGGSAARFINKIYGDDVPITAVDFSEGIDQFLLPNVTLVSSDAKEHVKTAEKHDVVIVDLFDTGDNVPADFVTSEEFVSDLGKIANYIILHLVKGVSPENYDKQFNRIRHLTTNSGGKYEPQFYYYEVNRIDRLPVR